MLVRLTTPSDTEGTIRAVIEAGSVRRMGEVVSDSPAIPAHSPPLPIDTRDPIIPKWDITDSTVDAGTTGVQIGIEFNHDVRLPDGRALEENPQAWIRAQGIEINFDNLTVIPLTDDDSTDGTVDKLFALRLANAPTERIANDTEFTVIIRTTFGKKLTSAPTSATNAIMVSAGTPVSICTILCNESYGFAIRTPATGTGTITITALETGWSVLSENQVMGTVDYGAPAVTIGTGSVTGNTLTFTATWSPDVGAGRFDAKDITVGSDSSGVSVVVDSVTPVTANTYTAFTVSATVTGQGANVTLTANVRAGAIPETAMWFASPAATQVLGSFTFS